MPYGGVAKGSITSEHIAAGAVSEVKRRAAKTVTLHEYDYGFTLDPDGAEIIHLRTEFMYPAYLVSNAATAIADGERIGQELLIVLKEGFDFEGTIKILDYANTRLCGDWYITTPFSTAPAGLFLALRWDGSLWNEIARATGNQTESPGSHATAMGSQTTASGDNALAHGESTQATAGNSQAGGDASVAAGLNSVAGGASSNALAHSEWCRASGKFGSVGDAQEGSFTALGWTWDDMPITIYPADSPSYRFLIQSNAVYALDALVVARRTDMPGEVAAFRVTGLIRNSGGFTSVSGVSTTVIHYDDPFWSVTLSADDINNALNINVTGAFMKTIRWVASVRYAKVM